MMFVTDWILAVCTVLSLGGAAFSWWRANLSRKAQRESEAAAGSAEQTLVEIRRQTLALEGLVAAVTPDPLVLEHDAGVLWRLRNTTSHEIAIERVENLRDFVSKPLDLVPIVISPRGTVEVTLLAVWGHPVPAIMELRVRGVAEVVRVSIPPGVG